MPNEPIAVSMEIPPAELAAFDALLAEIAGYTGREKTQIVRQAARFFCQSAGKATPTSKKYRAAELNPDRQKVGRKLVGPKWRARQHTQSGKSWWVYGDAKRAPAFLIKRRGLAKNTWKAMIGKLPQSSAKLTGETKGSPIPGKVTSATVKDAGDESAITMVNRLSYLHKIAPDLARQAMLKTHRRMETYHLRKMQRDWDKIWRT